MCFVEIDENINLLSDEFVCLFWILRRLSLKETSNINLISQWESKMPYFDEEKQPSSCDFKSESGYATKNHEHLSKHT